MTTAEPSSTPGAVIRAHQWLELDFDIKLAVWRSAEERSSGIAQEVGSPPLEQAVARQLASIRGRGWLVALVTNGDSGIQEEKVERIGLAPLLDACLLSGAVGIRKPDPRIIELAAHACQTGLGRGQLRTVGGDPRSIRSSRSR